VNSPERINSDINIVPAVYIFTALTMSTNPEPRARTDKVNPHIKKYVYDSVNQIMSDRIDGLRTQLSAEITKTVNDMVTDMHDQLYHQLIEELDRRQRMYAVQASNIVKNDR
jgi:hypothetical protein